MKTIELASKVSSYKIRVIVHKTHAQFKRATKDNNDEPKRIACCVLLEFPSDDWFVAELHFSEENFSPALVAHESVHAAMYQAKLSGMVAWSDSLEEYVAEMTQGMVEAILDKLDEN